MAVVNIEMSEYKAMEAKAEMLEEMRQTERKLHEEIKSIEQEKSAELKKLIEENKKLLEEAHEETLKAYKNAEMKVVKTVRHETHEHKLINNLEFSNFTRDFIISMNLPEKLKIDLLEYLRDRGRRYTDGFQYYHTGMDLSSLVDKLFKPSISTSYSDPIVTTHGLDEIKAEIYDNIKKEIDDDTKEKLEKFEEFSKKYFDILKEKKELESELATSQNNVNTLFDSNIDLAQKNKMLNEKLGIIKSEIKNSKWWKSFLIVKRIKSLIKKW